MSFQSKEPFFTFLKGAASTAMLAEAAPAENYLLDERISDRREADFLAFTGFHHASPGACSSWFAQHCNYTKIKVARRGSPPGTVGVTFTADNDRAWLTVNSAEDVVRIETIEGLCDRAPTELKSDEARALIQRMLDAQNVGGMTNDVEFRLKKWLHKVNSGKDSRPAFVAPFAEVELILKRSDWANRMRDALGLGHIRATVGSEAPILLMKYSLDRVRLEYLGKAPAWAAAPCVLDDVARAGPNPCFFPAPEYVSQGYGYTVDLDETDATWRREFLHAPISYELNDIMRIGLVTTDVTEPQIEKARNLHRSLLRDDLKHFADVPRRS